jgi:broad specificity phosphatase PhoE
LNLIPIPIIFTSVLSRAIETGDIIAKNHDDEPIYVLPFIEEKPFSVNLSKFIYLDRQNAPRNKNVLEEDLGVHINVINSANPYKNNKPYLIVEINKFYENILSNVIDFLEKKGFEINENTVIILVSHRNTIDMATGIKKLGNCGMVL